MDMKTNTRTKSYFVRVRATTPRLLVGGKKLVVSSRFETKEMAEAWLHAFTTPMKSFNAAGTFPPIPYDGEIISSPLTPEVRKWI